MKEPVAITSINSISPLGRTPNEIWENYQTHEHFFQEKDFDNIPALAAFLPDSIKEEVVLLKEENSKYRYLDDSVLYGILVGRDLISNSSVPKMTALNVGSSRGATGLFEKYHSEYIKTGRSSTYSSPSTTLGNISSWLAQDMQLEGPDLSHSITCSTGMHSVLNGIAWLKSGLTDSFIAGASEAPLTGFTISQMRAMKIYSDQLSEFPCRSLDMNKDKNTMILSEAASLMVLENQSENNAKAYIKGIGYANENLTHGASLSKDGYCLQKSMEMAIQSIGRDNVDVIIMHAPGTIGGDRSEVNAVRKVFRKDLPAMTSNKWKIGHSFATSGLLSIEMAILMLQRQKFLGVPFSEFSQEPDKLENVLVNSVGFGGNAVSVLIGRDC